MSTKPHDPDRQLDDDDRATLHLARRVRRYPGHPSGWPLFKPDDEHPNTPRRSRGPVHLHYPRPVDNSDRGP